MSLPPDNAAHDRQSKTGAERYLDAEVQRRLREREQRRRKGLDPSWRTALATLGVVTGFLGGIIWGFLALRSMRNWNPRGVSERPSFAWFLGVLFLAALSFGLVFGVVTCWSPRTVVATLGVGSGVGLSVFGDPSQRWIGVLLLLVGLLVGAIAQC